MIHFLCRFAILTTFYIIFYFVLACEKVFSSAELHALVAYVLVLSNWIGQCMQQTAVTLVCTIAGLTLHLLAAFVNKVVVCESESCRFKIRLTVILRFHTVAPWTSSVVVGIGCELFA